MSKPADLARALTLRTATAIVIGSIIGSGIFKKTATMSDDLPSPLMVLGVWVVAGLITFMGGLSAAELGAAFPESGGLYAHLRKILGRFSGFLYGWSVMSVIQTGSIASLAYVFAQYLGYFLPLGSLSPEADAQGWVFLGTIDVEPFKDLWTRLVAVGLICLLTLTNVIGVRLGGAVQDVMTGLKLAVVFGVVVLAAFGPGDFGHVTGPDVVPPGMGGAEMFAALTLAMSGAFWAYDGWINVTYVGSELKNPQRDTPRALAMGLSIVTVVYVAVNVAYYYLLPLEEIRSSSLVAAAALGRVVPFGAALAAAFVVISTFGTTNGTILASARVSFAMGRDGLMPAALGEVHRGTRTPWVALLVQGLWSAVLVFSGTFDQITDMLIFVSWAFYGLLAVAVIVARVRFPEARRPFKVPGYPVVPILFILFSGVYVVESILENTRNAMFGCVLVAAGIPVWFWAEWRRRKTRT